MEVLLSGEAIVEMLNMRMRKKKRTIKLGGQIDCWKQRKR